MQPREKVEGTDPEEGFMERETAGLDHRREAGWGCRGVGVGTADRESPGNLGGRKGSRQELAMIRPTSSHPSPSRESYVPSLGGVDCPKSASGTISFCELRLCVGVLVLEAGGFSKHILAPL